MGPALQDMLVLLKMKPDNGVNVMALAPAGALGLIGLNSAGISVDGNMLIHRSYTSPAGIVPHDIITRKSMESKNIGKAISAVARARRDSAVHMLFGSSQGDVISIEATPDDRGFVPC